MNIDEIAAAARAVLALRAKYTKPPCREMALDLPLFAYLSARHGAMTRQVPVQLGVAKPKRIDFRHGGTNPVVIEFVVRSASGLGTIYGSQNRSELRKLSRIPQSQAKLRALLLMDVSPSPLEKPVLKSTYDGVTLGKGNFTRMAVTVIYVHADREYRFNWKP